MGKRKQRSIMADMREDRLSSLPDALLIEIICLLPLKSAIITEALLRRWRNLWTYLISICVNNLSIGFFKAFDRIMHKLSSPFIHTCTLQDLQDCDSSNYSNALLNRWIRQVCERNVRHLDLVFPNRFSPHAYRAVACIFQTTSLVSIKLRPEFCTRILKLMDSALSSVIPLPNLNKLDIYIVPLQCEWLSKLIEACPLLEELSFMVKFHKDYYKDTVFVNCSSPNLKRLSMDLTSSNSPDNKVVIDAPKLEYLFARAQKASTFSFCGEPVSLQEANIKFKVLSSKWYEGISNVRILTDLSPDINVLDTFIAFPNLTRLTLEMKSYDNPNSLLNFLALCPELDVLILNFEYAGSISDKMWVLPKRASDTTLGRVKRIEIDTRGYLYNYQYFSKVVEYMLRSASSLEQLHFTINGGREWRKELNSTTSLEHREYMLCDSIYKYRMASKKCELVFTGRYLAMFRKAGVKRPSIRQA